MEKLTFTVTVKKGDEVHNEIVSVESDTGTIPNSQFVALLPEEVKDWEIVDIKKHV